MKNSLSQLTVLALSALLLFSCGNKNTTQNQDKDKDYSLTTIDTAGAVTGDWVIHRELADPQKLNPITVQDATGQEYTLTAIVATKASANVLHLGSGI